MRRSQLPPLLSRCHDSSLGHGLLRRPDADHPPLTLSRCGAREPRSTTITASASPIRTAGSKTPIRPRPKRGSRPRTGSPIRLPGDDSGAGGDQEPADPALELCALFARRSRKAAATSTSRTPGFRIRAFSTSRTAERAAARTARSEHALVRWNRRAVGTGGSDDGHYLAYSISTSGSDWQELHVRDVDTGARPAGHPQVGQVLGNLLDARQQGIFLLAVRRADVGQQDDQRQPQSEDLLPSRRPAPVARRADLRPARPARLAVRRAGHRRRTVPDHHRPPGHRRQRTRLVLHRSRQSGQAARSTIRSSD